MASRDKSIYFARLAEQGERYEDMIRYMKEVVKVSFDSWTVRVDRGRRKIHKSSLWRRSNLFLFKLSDWLTIRFIRRDNCHLMKETFYQLLTRILWVPAGPPGGLFLQYRTRKSTRAQNTSSWSRATATKLKRSLRIFARTSSPSSTINSFQMRAQLTQRSFT